MNNSTGKKKVYMNNQKQILIRTAVPLWNKDTYIPKQIIIK